MQHSCATAPVGHDLLALRGAATKLVAVYPALLAKAGGCGTHVPPSFSHAPSTRTERADGDAGEIRQSSPKPGARLRCLGASQGRQDRAQPGDAGDERCGACRSRAWAPDVHCAFVRNGRSISALRAELLDANGGMVAYGAKAPVLHMRQSARGVIRVQTLKRSLDPAAPTNISWRDRGLGVTSSVGVQLMARDSPEESWQ
jgi:hypothetical protein